MTIRDRINFIANVGRTLRRIVWYGVGLAALAAGVAAPAAAQYTINWSTIDGGGATKLHGATYILGSTIGQPDAGSMAGGVYSLKGGFWRGGETLIVGVGDDGDDKSVAAELPIAFRLHAAFPNPLIRNSAIAFDLPATRFVRMRIFDASGRVARTLAEGTLAAGRHHRSWEGVDDNGRPVSAGIYFVRFDSETDHASQKIIVLR